MQVSRSRSETHENVRIAKSAIANVTRLRRYNKMHFLGLKKFAVEESSPTELRPIHFATVLGMSTIAELLSRFL